MSEIAESLSFNVAAYYDLTSAHQQIVQFLAELTLTGRQKGWKKIWPSFKKIAFFCGAMSIKTIQRFIQQVNGIFLKIERRFLENGRETTHSYEFETGFWNALKWLSKRNLLNAPYEKRDSIIEEAKRYEEKSMSTSPPSLYAEDQRPPYSLTLLTGTQFKRGFIHPKIQKIRGLSEMNKEILSREPENLLMLALEDAMKCKEIIRSPRGYLMGKINKYRKRQNG